MVAAQQPGRGAVLVSPVDEGEDAVRGQQAQHPVQRARVDLASQRQLPGGDRIVVDVVGYAQLRCHVQAPGGHTRVREREDQLVRFHGGAHLNLAGALVRETHASNPSNDGLSSVGEAHVPQPAVLLVGFGHVLQHVRRDIDTWEWQRAEHLQRK